MSPAQGHHGAPPRRTAARARPTATSSVSNLDRPSAAFGDFWRPARRNAAVLDRDSTSARARPRPAHPSAPHVTARRVGRGWTPLCDRHPQTCPVYSTPQFEHSYPITFGDH